MLAGCLSLQVELVDFGATREYSKEFIDNWLHLLSAAAADDREACITWSQKVGYLTGQEDTVSDCSFSPSRSSPLLLSSRLISHLSPRLLRTHSAWSTHT